MALIDSYNRTIDYLRVSVTDRCNFRCVYCMPDHGAPIAPKEEILSYEEIVRLVRISVGLGITKVRITGGEPLVRKDIGLLVRLLGEIDGITDLSMTTNGMLLSEQAESFARDGLTRVNVSLDTLRPERFQRLARRGNLAKVLEGIEAALKAGLAPVKLNCVVMRDWNHDEAAEFARLTLSRRIDVRFIELMPINWSQGDDHGAGAGEYFALAAEPNYQPNSSVSLYAREDLDSLQYVFHSLSPVKTEAFSHAEERASSSSSEFESPKAFRSSGSTGPSASERSAQSDTLIRTIGTRSRSTGLPSERKVTEADRTSQLDGAEMRRAFVSTAETRAGIEAQFGSLEEAVIKQNGPSRSFRIPGATGTIGFISQITSDQCLSCNRLRLTADGQLRPCLMADGEVDLKTALRGGAADSEIERLFRLTVLHKPREHRIEDGIAPTGRNMSQLGG